MNGYIYEVNTRKIATKIENVRACNDTTILGDSKAVIGTGEYLITEDDYLEGEVLPESIVDERCEIPVLPILY